MKGTNRIFKAMLDMYNKCHACQQTHEVVRLKLSTSKISKIDTSIGLNLTKSLLLFPPMILCCYLIRLYPRQHSFDPKKN